jgi:hypothetical protein
MAKTITRETKKRQKGKAKDDSLHEPKEKERASPFCVRKLSHPWPMTPLMSLTHKLWDLIIMGGLEHASLANTTFLSITKATTCWREILIRCLKNWMQKDKDKWFPNCLLWKRWAHSMIKQSISCLCDVQLHGHWNKMVPFMKPSILADLTNGFKFRSCTWWSSNDAQTHCLPHWVNNHHIKNENLILSSHVEIDA